MIRTSRCLDTIFSKYLALPIATFPFKRVRPAPTRHLFPRQGNPLPIKLLTLSDYYDSNITFPQPKWGAEPPGSNPLTETIICYKNKQKIKSVRKILIKKLSV